MKVKVAQSCPHLCDPRDYPWNPPGQNTEVGSLSLLQRFFLTQGSNLGLLHCKQIFYPLSHQVSLCGYIAGNYLFNLKMYVKTYSV